MKQERYNRRHQNNNAEINTTNSELVVSEESRNLDLKHYELSQLYEK
jgi:hypothetical protein